MEPKRETVRKRTENKTDVAQKIRSWAISSWSQSWRRRRVHGGKDLWHRWVLSKEWRS